MPSLENREFSTVFPHISTFSLVTEISFLLGYHTKAKQCMVLKQIYREDNPKKVEKKIKNKEPISLMD